MPSGAPWFPVEQPPAPPPAALYTHLDCGQFQILNCIFFSMKMLKEQGNVKIKGSTAARCSVSAFGVGVISGCGGRQIGCRLGDLWLPERPRLSGPEVASLSVSGACPRCTVLQLLEGFGLVCPSAQAGPWGLWDLVSELPLTSWVPWALSHCAALYLVLLVC